MEALQQESISHPDLVVLDVNLPTLDGWEVCRRIKARREVPIMLLTVRAEGHGTYPFNRCATRTVNTYLLDGTTPERGTTCS